MINLGWHVFGLRIMVEFLPFNTISDHSAMLVSTVDSSPLKARSFKFLNLWMMHPNFLRMIRENWNSSVFGTKQFILCMKLKQLKGPLKSMHSGNFSHIVDRVKAAHQNYSEIMDLLMHNPDSESLKARAKDGRKQVNFLLEAENQFYQQKIKVKHITQADRNSKYFHALMRKKNASSFIPALVKADGTITTSQEEFIKDFLDYYKTLLGSDSTVSHTTKRVFEAGPVLTEEDCAALIEPIDDVIIKEALFHIGDDKAPGPDGFSATFFKENWDIIKHDFLGVVHEFFQNGKILKQLNHAAISLISKTKHQPIAADFRPISCCNVVYKTISRILATRMAKILSQIVDKAQAAFIEDRCMADNMFLAQQLVKSYGRSTATPRCMMMPDIRKAFDTISWNFLRNMMQGLFFPKRFTDWVMECISSTMYSISYNGSLHGFFPGKRGIRQGTPFHLTSLLWPWNTLRA